MPLGQIQSVARDLKRVYLTPALKKAVATLNVHTPQGGTFAIAVGSPVLADRPLDQSLTLNANSRQEGHGVSIARDGSYMAVGTNTPNVIIYKRVNDQWVFSSIIGVSGASQCRAVALNGDGSRLVIGDQSFSSTQALQGRASTYTRSGDVFSLTANFISPNVVSSGNFGEAVAISNDGTVVYIGAPGETVTNGAAGRTYVFAFAGGAATLTLDQGTTANARFGSSLSVSDRGRLAVGRPSNGSVIGTVILYDTTGGLRQTISDPLGAPSGRFGSAVALNADGDVLVVGARTATGPSDGRAYIYTADFVDATGTNTGVTTQFSLVQTLTPAAPTGNAGFGTSCAITSDGKNIVVGAAIQNHPTVPGATQNGAFYLYKRFGYTWVQTRVSFSPEAQPNQNVGQSVSIALNSSQLWVAAGAIGADTNTQPNTGAVYTSEEPALTSITDEIQLAAGESIEKTGIVLEPADAVYLINREDSTVNATLVGYSEDI